MVLWASDDSSGTDANDHAADDAADDDDDDAIDSQYVESRALTVESPRTSGARQISRLAGAALGLRTGAGGATTVASIERSSRD